MANIIREIVSENKVRYQRDGYDLDLTYITPNIIAMGYPSFNLEAVYRNDASDVVRFLDEKHPGHYLVVNLCIEKDYQYDPRLFHGRACSFPIADHGPPPFNMLLPFCRQVDDWLSRSPRNVVAVHCRAGRDRTGTMISSYFLYKGMARTAEEAINLFAFQRTYDGKRVVIPSQRRYVKYFEQMLAQSCGASCAPDSIYHPMKLLLTAIRISPAPTRAGFDCDLFFTVQSKGKVFYTSDVYDSERNVDPRTGSLVMVPHKPLKCCEDVKVVIYNRSILKGKEELLRIWFNTFFISSQDQGPQQQIVSTSAGFNNRLATGSGACMDCQSNQQYLTEGPNGAFVSVVRLSNTGPRDHRRPVRSSSSKGCHCQCPRTQSRYNAGVQKTLTLNKTEMEGGEKIGLENLTVTLYFADS